MRMNDKTIPPLPTQPESNEMKFILIALQGTIRRLLESMDIPSGGTEESVHVPSRRYRYDRKRCCKSGKMAKGSR